MGVRISMSAAFMLTAMIMFYAVAAVAGAADPAAGAAYDADVASPGLPPLHLHVEEIGHGPPVLLIHGLGASGYGWRHIAPVLARSHRVIMVDLKGFGLSDKPFDLGYSPQDQARLLARFLDRRGIKRVSVVGHSFGGAVALLLALELNSSGKAQLDRLVLIDTPAYPQPLSLQYQLMMQPVLPYVGLTLLPPTVAARMGLTSDQSDPGRITLDDIKAYAAPFYQAATRHAFIATVRAFVATDSRQIIARYPTIRQPALVVWCRADSVVPIATGVRLTRALGNARLRTIDGCDHVPNEERPEALAPLLAQFLR